MVEDEQQVRPYPRVLPVGQLTLEEEKVFNGIAINVASLTSLFNDPIEDGEGDHDRK